MKIEAESIYKCDICGSCFVWDKTKHISITFLLSAMRNWEHEFHLCSNKCEKELRDMGRVKRQQLAKKNNEQRTKN